MTHVAGDWLIQAATQAVFDAYEANGAQLYFVGGCVRNALLQDPVSDIDLCSDAIPDTAKRFLEAQGFRVIPTGIEHGTLTVISAGIAHEITTFREDVSTDGRRATVAFSTRIEDDARRRDFTVNALYADRTGRVIDPLNGLPDIADRRVRFIEDAQARIQEDYLRILRYFRFHGRIAPDAPDAETLDAIARNIDGLAQLSVERITSEMLKILALPNPAPTVGIMQQIGVLMAVLPGAVTTWLGPLTHLEAMLHIAPDPVLRVAALGGPQVIDSLRLSKKQARAVSDVHAAAGSAYSVAALGYLYGAERAMQIEALRCAVFEKLPEPAEQLRADAQRGGAARFPVRAADLSDQEAGPALGARLTHLKSAWLASDLTLSKAALLDLPTI